jgi:uncharacterized membrane protein YjjB (DUF3815 family)
MSLWELLARDAFWSGIAAMGFAILFNVPPRTLTGCVICGAVGHAIRTLLVEEFAFSIITATLTAATCVGFLAWEFARLWRVPTPIFAVSGSIPLVPGVFAYQTALGILKIATAGGDGENSDILFETSRNGITTALVLGAIAAGIIAPKLLFRRSKPVV